MDLWDQLNKEGVSTRSPHTIKVSKSSHPLLTTAHVRHQCKLDQYSSASSLSALLNWSRDCTLMMKACHLTMSTLKCPSTWLKEIRASSPHGSHITLSLRACT